MWILIAIAAFFLLSKSGSLGSLGGLLAPSLYQLTPADISEIASHYHDGSNTFQIQDNNNPFIGPGVQRYSLAHAMQLAIQNLQVVAYAGDGYCQGTGANPAATGTDAISAISAGYTAKASQVATSLAVSQQGVSAASDLSGIASAIPIVGAIAGIATAVFGFLSAHHAARVQEENKILCPLLPMLNGWYQYIAQQMRSGAWNGATVMTNVQAVQQDAHQAIAQDSSSGALNAVKEEVDAITEAFGLIVKNSGI